MASSLFKDRFEKTAATENTPRFIVMFSAAPWGAIVGEFGPKVVNLASRTGFLDQFLEAAEQVLNGGHEALKSAMNSPMSPWMPAFFVSPFYGLLFNAYPFFRAGKYAYQALLNSADESVAQLRQDPTMRERWEKRSIDCEEKCVRISESLNHALIGVDGRLTAAEINEIQKVKAKDELQAEMLVRQYIYNQLYYPPSFKDSLLQGK